MNYIQAKAVPPLLYVPGFDQAVTCMSLLKHRAAAALSGNIHALKISSNRPYSTKADDGDPIDIMVIHDATTIPGLIVTCRVIGILQIEQKSKRKAERNDRLFAVPKRSHSEKALKDVWDLSRPIQEELEKFFIATDELEDKKLKIIGWKGPKAAMQAINDAAKSFAKNDQ